MTATRRTPSRSDIATVILGLEASGGLLSVALWADGCIQAEQSHAAKHGHAALIAPMVDAVMKAANCGFSDLSHIAAGRGPGSFTGIRVALAMAKGLCLATGVVGVGVNGLAHWLHIILPLQIWVRMRCWFRLKRGAAPAMHRYLTEWAMP